MIRELETDTHPLESIDARSYEDSNIVELQLNGTWYKATPAEVADCIDELEAIAAHADPTTDSSNH